MATSKVLEKLFGVRKPIIGNIHCLPFPGSPRYEEGGMKRAISQAVSEAQIMTEAGIDGLIVENAGDTPYARPENIGPETVSALAVVVYELGKVVEVPIGVICLANGVLPSLAIAAIAGAKFIRANIWAHAYVGMEGLMQGQADEALRYRKQLNASEVLVLADVHVKYGAHNITSDRSITDLARDVEFADADVLVATGTRSGQPTSEKEVDLIKKGTTKEVIVGSGLNPDNAPSLLKVADGAIVGSWLKTDGHWRSKVSKERTKKLMDAVRSIR